MDVEIPDKRYFRIGEISEIVGVKPYVLRYWETEFKVLRPQKTKSKQRIYRRRDVKLLLTIKKLLYEEGFTIAGARRKLKEPAKPAQKLQPPSPQRVAGEETEQRREALEQDLHSLKERCNQLEQERERVQADLTASRWELEALRRELSALKEAYENLKKVNAMQAGLLKELAAGIIEIRQATEQD